MAPVSSTVIDPVTIREIEAIAKHKLTKQAWDYYRTGADDEETLQRNKAIYDRLFLRPRVLRDVSNIDTSTTILGKQYAFPIAIAPSAYQKLCHLDGELAMSRAAKAVGVNFILSSNATTSLEQVMVDSPVADDAAPNFWFQLYVHRDRDVAKRLIERAEAAGYEALCVTVDSPILGNRIHERREPLVLPPGLTKANLTGSGASKSRLVLNAKTAAEARELSRQWEKSLNDDSLTWSEFIPWLKTQTKMKILLKGIMTCEDAKLAAESGVDGVMVSNHGGRQLDDQSSTLEALAEIAPVVAGRLPLVFDGGITKGSDVFKAIALDADLCLIGRSALWGLAYNGQDGVEEVLHILERELWRTMTLCGASSLKEISGDMLGVERHGGCGIARL